MKVALTQGRVLTNWRYVRPDLGALRDVTIPHIVPYSVFRSYLGSGAPNVQGVLTVLGLRASTSYCISELPLLLKYDGGHVIEDVHAHDLISPKKDSNTIDGTNPYNRIPVLSLVKAYQSKHVMDDMVKRVVSDASLQRLLEVQ